MTPSESRLRRERAAFRRRRRRQGAALALLVIAVVVAGVALIGGGSAGGRHAARRSVTGAHTLTARAPALSAAGLPLAAPAFRLAGLNEPARDPIQLTFAHPPRAGLLFNLQTGQVLWQRNAYRRVRIASLTKMMTALLTVKSVRADTPDPDHEGGRRSGRVEGRRAAAPQARARRDDALRAAAAVRQRRRDRTRRTRRRLGAGVRQADERRGGEPRDGMYPLLLPVGLLRPRATSPAPPTWRCSPTSTRNNRGSHGSSTRTRRCCRSRSRGASSTCTTTTRC